MNATVVGFDTNTATKATATKKVKQRKTSLTQDGASVHVTKQNVQLSNPVMQHLAGVVCKNNIAR